MGRVSIGVNLEFVRHADKPFEWAVAKAAELGYEYVEPWVHLGRELISEAGYFATISMWEDPYRIKKICDEAGVKISGLSSHTPLCKPDISGNYLKQAIRFAAECGAPVVNTDEGPKPSWTTEDEDHVLMRYVLAATGQPATTEDLVQDTLRIAYEHRDRFRPGTNLGAWLRGVARNVLHRHFRKLKKAPVLTGDVADALDKLCGEQEHVFADDEWQEQRIRAMRGCLAELSFKARRMFTERYARRRSANQLAGQFAMTVSAVNVMIFRVRGVLARCIKQRLKAQEA